MTVPPDARLCSEEDGWLTPIRFAIVLAALITAFFSDVLFASKAFVFRDFGIFTHPVAYFHRESFWQGQLPLWNPLNDCGVPFLAQWNTVALYPLSLIYLLLPLPWGLTLFFLAHLFLAGFGMYLLASNWTGNRLAAGIAGVAFVFNGMTLNCLMWASNLATLAWMPLVILAVERTWKNERRATIVAALAGAMQMLGGAPEIILLTWLIVAILWVGRLIREKQRLRDGLRVPVVVVLIGLLSAVQLLPFMDLLQHSERSSDMRAVWWPIPLWGWANLLLPLFHCYRSPAGVFFQPGQDWTSSYYAGIGVLGLALLSAVLFRRPRVWLLSAVAILGFILALGDNGVLYTLLLKAFPFLGFMRYPIKFAFLMTFALPLLAAFGFVWLKQLALSNWSSALRCALTTAFLVFGALIGLIIYAKVRPYPNEEWQMICQNGVIRAVILASVLALVLAGARILRARLQMILGLLLLGLFWLDVATHAPRQNPTVNASLYEPRALAKRIQPQPELGRFRAFVTQANYDRVYKWMLSDPDKDFLGRRLALLGNCNILDDIPIPGGFFSLHVKAQRQLFKYLYHSPPNEFPKGLADFFSISHISAAGEGFDWVYRPSHLPFGTVGPKPEFVAPSNTPAMLFSPDFDPRKVVYLPPEAAVTLPPMDAATGTILSNTFTAQRVTYDVEASAPTLLVISQTYYHPWHARVNGQPTEVLRANYAFQAVAIPAGRSRVELKYRDNSFLAGLILSSLTLVGCVIVWWRSRPGMAGGSA